MHPTPWQWAILPLRRYAKFSGRAPRPEFWWFHLLTVGLWAVAIGADQLLPASLMIDKDIGPFGLGIVALTIVPWLAAFVRRLHDSGLSGWYLLAIFLPYVGVVVLLVLAVRRGIFGPNAYGEDPYGRSSSALVEPTVRTTRRG